MPQIFKIGSYVVFFWANEGIITEPVHVHIAEGRPRKDATKIWITSKGRCLLANNHSGIPPRQLRIMMEIIAAQSDDIVKQWQSFFGNTRFYC